MESKLGIIGLGVIVFSLMGGIMTGSLLGFIAVALGGFATSMIFFALSRIIENQNIIINKLDYQYSQELKARNIDKKLCTKCNKTYDVDYTSCPHCGNRD